MSLVHTSKLIADAVGRRGAVPAFNVITLEHAEAIAAGSPATGAILQLSENAIRFHGGDPAPILLACAAVARAARSPLALHLDHIVDSDLIDVALGSAREWGLGSIMIDASAIPYPENVAATAAAASRAHELGLWVEAELGEIGGKDGAHAPGVRTDPHEAEEFAKATGIDGLAVAVGSSHAMHERSADIDDALIARIAMQAGVPLVLHGSSGVPDDAIRRAVFAGIRKVNIGTALSLAATSTLRATLAAQPGTVDPRRYTAPVRTAMTAVVEHFALIVG